MKNKTEHNTTEDIAKDESYYRILTVPNVISFIRILMIPLFAYFLLNEFYTFAFLVFVFASISDGLDGFIARRTNSVTRLGKILDPIADRGLLIVAAICLCIIDRLPVWILVLVLLRDLSFLIGGGYLFKKYNIRIDVILLGKIATALFYIGFASLIIGIPFFQYGIGCVPNDWDWLPGFCYFKAYIGGIWLIYIAIILNIFTCIHYVKAAYQKYKLATSKRR